MQHKLIPVLLCAAAHAVAAGPNDASGRGRVAAHFNHSNASRPLMVAGRKQGTRRLAEAIEGRHARRRGRGRGFRRGRGRGRRGNVAALGMPHSYSGDAKCSRRGVYNPVIPECRCTAGWGGSQCELRQPRQCNNFGPGGRGGLNNDGLCAGNCDEDRGLCYCAGLAAPYQRPLPHTCAPMAHRTTRLPDGRPAYPLLRGGPERVATLADFAKPEEWDWAPVNWERKTEEKPWLNEWTRPWGKPLEYLYGKLEGNPRMPGKATSSRKGHCQVPDEATYEREKPSTHVCGGCFEGRTGPLCESPKRSYCVRDCMGRGWCDSGFCWCEPLLFGVDCSMKRLYAGGPVKLAPSLQQQQELPSPVATSPLRVYVYEMPSLFTTNNLQYRPTSTVGLHRAYNAQNGSHFTMGSLYAMEGALHEWLLDSPLRTTDPMQAHLFFVPVYLASLFMWPVNKWSDEPYIGRARHENRRRSHQGSLLLLEAVKYIQKTSAWWQRRNGTDHIWMMLHDEGPCFAPLAIRSSILLTHYGYYSAHPRPWGTYYDDNFLADKGFYRRHLGDPDHPTQCFKPRKDLVISPWKTPGFWQSALSSAALRNPAVVDKPRKGLVFFAGDLGFRRLMGYSHDLRQRAFSMFCDPRTTKIQDCTPYVYGCRKELPQNCSRWREGVLITTHSSRYHAELTEHTFCLAFPGDGWSSRVLDAVIHGCIPVVVQDESEMFFEGAFAESGLDFDYSAFSIRLAEADLPEMVNILLAVPAAKVLAMRRNVLKVRDYFIYKDMYNPDRFERSKLLAAGRAGQDGFLMLTLALEARARRLGVLSEPEQLWKARNRALLGNLDLSGVAEEGAAR